MGSVAERSKALVLGTSLFGGVGSNPTAATVLLRANVSVFQVQGENAAHVLSEQEKMLCSLVLSKGFWDQTHSMLTYRMNNQTQCSADRGVRTEITQHITHLSQSYENYRPID